MKSCSGADYIDKINAYKDSVERNNWRVESELEEDDEIYSKDQYFDGFGTLVKVKIHIESAENEHDILNYYKNKNVALKIKHINYTPYWLSNYFYVRDVDIFKSAKLHEIDRLKINIIVREYYCGDSLYKSFIRLPGTSSFINQKTPLKEVGIEEVVHNVFLHDNSLLNIYLSGFTKESLNAENLRYLIGIKKNIKHIPDSLYNLDKLRYLSLKKNDLTSFEYQSLPLKMLNLSENKISYFGGVKKADSLILLNLSKNALKELDPSFKKLNNLRVLVLSNNHLSVLPDENAYMDSLAYLCLENNLLSEFDFGACNLKRLHLQNNKITSFPGYFPCPEKLEHLSLSGNELEELFPTISRFKNLKTLLLSNNNLTELPVEIGALSKLESLYLNDNNITQLPKEICNLKKLRTLEISDNQLTSLPEGLIELKKKAKLRIYVKNNNFPKELVSRYKGLGIK